MEKEKKKSYKDYLDKTFLEELNYKIWSTKGSRFNANKRLLKTANSSKICTTALTIYLVLIGLFSVYSIYSTIVIDENLIAYSVTCISILLLVIGQIEKAKDFSTKATLFHTCNLELSKLYNHLRIFKTLKENPSFEEKKEFAGMIADKFEEVLEKHQNHQGIDYEMFKSSTAKYHELNKFAVLKIKINYYLKTSFIYHVLILLPPIIIIGLLTKDMY